MKRIERCFLLMGFTLLFLVGCQKEMTADRPEVDAPAAPVEAIPEQPTADVPQQPAVNILPEIPKLPAEQATEAEGRIHSVEIDMAGFVPNNLTIKAGDTVRWTVLRSGNLDKAMINGAQICVNVKSGILTTGESFEWTFDEPLKCNIVDGITLNHVLRLTVED